MRIYYKCKCGKQLSYQGERSKGKKCRTCITRWRLKNDPTFTGQGFKKGNKYGKKFRKGGPPTKGSFRKGHKLSFESLCKMRRKKIGRRASPVTEFKPSGKKKEYRKYHHLYDPKYVAWRNKVFARDNWTCRDCGKRGGRLEAHHIKSWILYPKLRYRVSNGRTLCEKCHGKRRRK